MPLVPRLFIRTAFAWFAAGFVWAAAITLIKVADRAELRHAFITAHAHILLVGFLMNIVMGVAFWMFPRPPDRRMNEPLAAVAYVLLNVGLLIRVSFEWAHEEYQYQVYGVLLGASGVLQALGGLIFAYVIWPRVRAARIPPHLQAPNEPPNQERESPPHR